MAGLPMMRAVKSVRDEVLRRCDGREIDIETVAKVFTDLTIIDEIGYAPFDAGIDNPFWGRFSRWSRSPGVYASSVTVVEVAYAAHLDSTCRKFTVCKELCHALETSGGGSTVSANQMDNLVAAFAIRSAVGDMKEHMITFAPELLAEIGALEILFPLDDREEILAQNDTVDDALIEEMAEKYDIPHQYAALGLNAGYNEAVKALMDGDFSGEQA